MIAFVFLGILICIFVNRKVKKMLIFGKYHIHHTLHGIIFILAGVIILDEYSIAKYLIAFGAGLVIHHFFSEDNLKILEKHESVLDSKLIKLVKCGGKKHER